MTNLSIATLGLAALLFFVYACGAAQTGEKVLDATAFQKAVEGQEIQLIDVRTPGEYADGHLQNARNIDWFGDNFDAQIQTLSKEKPTYVYCKSGGRSAKSASKLEAAGFKDVYDLKGGITAWKGQGLPVVK